MNGSKKTIVLVGLMGAGKSSIGWRLAKRLDLPFIDVDRVIEEREKCSVSELFELAGEPYFRKREKEIITELLDGEPCIMAPGGGAFMDKDIRRLIKKKAVSVWLNATYDVLLDRVSRRKNRPLLEKGNKAEALRNLYDKRSAVYATADVTVSSDDGPHHRVVERILQELGYQ